MNDFHGRKAIVTGATRGIGRAVSLGLLERGAAVFGLYGSDEQAAQRLAEECREHAPRLTLVRCDVADYQAVQNWYEGFEAEYDTVDILVNNAGIRRDQLTALMDRESWQRVLDVNLTGTFTMSKFAVPLMLKQKYGRIISVTSPASYLGFLGQGNYAAAKAGQIGLTRTLAKEVARKKITVNCVSPGFIDTDFIGDLTEEQRTTYRKLVPMKRFGTAAEVADAILFLASEKASYITGTVLEITGGL
ncbi:SDR family oxidoreductase [Desulfofustis limnaeus]|jgi:3-oxoacyl-[acyl-carrier protein] reductase|uniref:Beta-ketoacyl-ACP reductase n=1 Tax=Desulfofustis limnaeus TaxID=2740163 RepID=A0ABM7W8L4_9BACT|nr:SDR family NAD(P)-dependent oxidoreductase [Desulfofustis limnaeus]MDX9894373.1 SDR family NAD(P)-dependent oxidoreductase [Desulfofustis sp.]BDD87256.1 beta-ketoacyl-ACP reductase [Desulfofustis limnaeus]